MQYLSYAYLLLDRDFMILALSGVATFATIVTLGLPYMKGDPLEDRMKAVAERREELRRKAQEAMAQANRRGQLRSAPIGFMKRTVDNFNLEKLAQSPGMKEKLVRAGYRGQAPVIAFMFFRFVMPPVPSDTTPETRVPPPAPEPPCNVRLKFAPVLALALL